MTVRYEPSGTKRAVLVAKPFRNAFRIGIVSFGPPDDADDDDVSDAGRSFASVTWARSCLRTSCYVLA